MISFTKHAAERQQQRHPDWDSRKGREMAELAMRMGQLMPGNNGCKRYRFMGYEWVIDDKNGPPVVVTVVWKQFHSVR